MGQQGQTRRGKRTKNSHAKKRRKTRKLPKRRKLQELPALAIFLRRKRLFLQNWYSRDTSYMALECVQLRMRLGPAMSFSRED
jgi:hypothetical protein